MPQIPITSASATLTLLTAADVALLNGRLAATLAEVYAIQPLVATAAVKTRLAAILAEVWHIQSLLTGAAELPPLTDSAGDVMRDSGGNVMYGSLPASVVG